MSVLSVLCVVCLNCLPTEMHKVENQSEGSTGQQEH